MHETGIIEYADFCDCASGAGSRCWMLSPENLFDRNSRALLAPAFTSDLSYADAGFSSIRIR
jgi:hypothetical protein